MRSKALLSLIFALVLISCTKVHTCTCTVSGGSKSSTDTVFVKTMNKSLKTDAQDACDAYYDLYYNAFNFKATTCTLK